MLTVEAAGVRVAEDLEAAEAAVNEAMRRVARLQLSMMNTRLDTELAQYEGQTSVVRVSQANAALVDGMNHLAKAHKQMRADFLRVTAGPDDYERCPARNLTELAIDAA